MTGCASEFLTERNIFLWDNTLDVGYEQIGLLVQNDVKPIAQNEGEL